MNDLTLLQTLSRIAKETERYGSRDRKIDGDRMKAIAERIEQEKKSLRGSLSVDVSVRDTCPYGL